MSPTQRRTVRLTLEIKIISFSADEPIPIHCPGCRSALNVHQPDADWPDQLLGTCEGCQSWYLIATSAEESKATLIRLPVNDLVRQG